jgi:hypothetical protein
MLAGNLFCTANLRRKSQRCYSRRFGVSAPIRVGVALLAVCGSWNVARGQGVEEAIATVPAVPQIAQAIDDAKLVQLKGNTHPLARAEFDQGPVAPALPMDRILLVLRRSPEREAALQRLMQEQIDPTSPNFHHWLTPEEFGANFGPADEDIQKVTAWLESHGFTVMDVSKGRLFIEFSGIAAQISETFHTDIHRYLVGGEAHIANATDPQIPATLSPVVAGIHSLNNFVSKPMHHSAGLMRRLSSGEWVPAGDFEPQFFINVNGANEELITPYDFATIYNVLPLWNGTTSIATTPIDGTGQKVAIAGRSDISLSDVATFRSSFGLPVNPPIVIVNGTDPGVPSATDKLENTLDVEWSGAVAKGATIEYITSATTNGTGGEFLSEEYIVDNRVAPVMSASYGACELQIGTVGNAAINSLWQQAATEGIAVFVATGDAGSALCDNPDLTAPSYATQGLQVNGLASTPYDVAVGGTDFNYVNNRSTYWNATNDPVTLSSAKGYIPEIPWNATCTNPLIDSILRYSSAEMACNDPLLMNSANGFLVNIVGGSGGLSACTAPTGSTPASCAGGYPRPSWQIGVGIPNGTTRALPDVSLFAANGVLGSAYLVCDSAQTTDSMCNFNSQSDVVALSVGGTSVSSPAMAGIMALINQRMGTPQGNPNSVFYQLAALETLSNCNSSTVGNGSACMFYDLTSGSNAMACTTGSPNCTTSTQGDASGVLTGYSAGVGYDLATGLGSANVANLVTGWTSVVTLQPAATMLTYNGPTTFTDGSAANPSALVTQTSGNSVVAGASISFTLSNGGAAQTCIGVTAANGIATCQIALVNQTAGASTIAASFAGNPSFSASAAGPIAVTILPPAAATTLTYTGPSAFTYGSAASLSATLTLTSGGNPVVGASVSFTLGSGANTQTCGGTTNSAGAASCSISSVAQNFSPSTVAAAFAGSATALASSTGPVAVTISSFNLSNSSGGQTVVAGQTAVFSIATSAIGGNSVTITFAASGLPTGAAATFSPTSVNPGASTTITITTTTRPVVSTVPQLPSGTNSPQNFSGSFAPWLALLLAATIFAIASSPKISNALRQTPQARATRIAMIVLSMSALGYVAGCSGGGGGGGSPAAPGTPAGVYTVTVTGTSGGTDVHSTTVALTVQ